MVITGGFPSFGTEGGDFDTEGRWYRRRPLSPPSSTSGRTAPLSAVSHEVDVDLVMSQGEWRDLRHLGVVHVLVISGLHIGLLASLSFLLFQLPRRLMRIPGDGGGMAFASVSALIVTGCYAALVGASFPVMRAYLMLVAAQLPQLFGWNTTGRPSRAGREWC